jgi:hypothetical protein
MLWVRSRRLGASAHAVGLSGSFVFQSIREQTTRVIQFPAFFEATNGGRFQSDNSQQILPKSSIL